MTTPGHTISGAELLAHLEAQISSAARLLASILGQGTSIRARDVEAVLGHMTDVQTEMSHRGRLEAQRTDLLERAGVALGVTAAAVTLDAMAALIAPGEADQARRLSAELRGLLTEIAREHGLNRALMRQELAFLDHLTRLIGQEPSAGYRRPGPAPFGSSAKHRVLDLQA